MNKSESIKELAKALSAAQGEFPMIPKTKKAKVKMKAGGEFSYNYADLSDIIKIISPVLSKNGLSISQDPVMIGDCFYLETTLMHSSGEWKTGLYPMRLLPTPQEQGAEITYSRRYALTSCLGIHADEDTDGHSPDENKSFESHDRPKSATQSAIAAVIKPKVTHVDTALEATSFDYGANTESVVPAPKSKEAKERAKIMADMANAMVKANWTAEQLRAYSKKKYNAEGSSELTNAEIQELIKTVSIYQYAELA